MAAAQGNGFFYVKERGPKQEDPMPTSQNERRVTGEQQPINVTVEAPKPTNGKSKFSSAYIAPALTILGAIIVFASGYAVIRDRVENHDARITKTEDKVDKQTIILERLTTILERDEKDNTKEHDKFGKELDKTGNDIDKLWARVNRR